AREAHEDPTPAARIDAARARGARGMWPGVSLCPREGQAHPAPRQGARCALGPGPSDPSGGRQGCAHGRRGPRVTTPSFPSPKDVEVAEVLRHGVRIGTLSRTTHGSRIDYDPAFLETAPREGGAAIHLPYRQNNFETRGVNLRSYVAGLLPEGLRLDALVRRVKTSEDDLFSLLMAIGEDTVGDLVVRI